MRNKKYLSKLLLTGLVVATITATGNTPISKAADNTTEIDYSSYISGSEISVNYDSNDINESWNSSSYECIQLNSSTIDYSGSNATVSDSTITITKGGTYVLSGTLNNGQVIVNSTDSAPVYLVLNNANISCSTASPIYIASAKKAILTLANGTNNSVSDGSNYSSSDEADSTIYSKDDLTINGSGSLKISANYNDALKCKDQLKIVNGTLEITSVDDGIVGKDFIGIKNATLTVNASGDGLKSTNDSDSSLGYISIANGTFDITSGSDAIQAESAIAIADGTFTLTTGGGSPDTISGNNNDGFGSNTTTTDTGSSKGLKAGSDLYITGGIFTIDSKDDALHTNYSLTTKGGTFTIATGDDAIHSESALTLNNSNVSVSKCYEGIESAIITINSGSYDITSSDDAINATDGSSNAGAFGTVGNAYLYINGGTVSLDAAGDGLDANGNIQMTGGTVLVCGPTNNGNGALDYDGTFNISGGILVASGSSGMAQAPSTSSSQASLMITYSSTQQANTIVHLQDSSGSDIVTFAPSKLYQNIVISTPNLKANSSYSLYTGGTYSNSSNNGLFTGGTYSNGTKLSDITLSGTVTSVSESGGTISGGEHGGTRPRG